MAEKIQSSDIDISIDKLLREDLEQVLSFSCGCEELDKFFHEEIYLCSRYHHVSAYCAKNTSNDEIVAIFTLANDSVVIDNVEDREDFVLESKAQISDEYISTFKRQTSFPAVNIGHLGVHKDMQSKGIGQKILDFVLYTFSEYNTSGCQFITVDSLNNSRTNKFYARNGFINQTDNDRHSPTRRMYLPIQPFAPQDDTESI